jgi:hypothetical protein
MPRFGCPPNETPEEAALRRTMGSENDSPACQLVRFVQEEAQAAVPNVNVWIIYRRDRFLRASDPVPFLDRRYPADRFTEPNEDSATSTRTSGSCSSRLRPPRKGWAGAIRRVDG